MLLVSLLILAGINSGCTNILIKNATFCSVAGLLSAGGSCSHLTTSDTKDLTFVELIDMIEAQNARTCVPVPGFNICAQDQSKGELVNLPARGAALILSSDDAGTLITELATACRKLGSSCTYEMRQGIRNISRLIKREHHL